jgi:hypothetical protein
LTLLNEFRATTYLWPDNKQINRAVRAFLSKLNAEVLKYFPGDNLRPLLGVAAASSFRAHSSSHEAMFENLTDFLYRGNLF